MAVRQGGKVIETVMAVLWLTYVLEQEKRTSHEEVAMNQSMYCTYCTWRKENTTRNVHIVVWSG